MNARKQGGWQAAMRAVPGLLPLFQLLLLSLALPGMVRGNPTRPHILIILADDWGYHDVGWSPYSDIPTPHLERLRQESLELMQFYVQPKCTASRAALMTARYPYKMGLQTKRVFSRAFNNTLDPSMKLFPAYMKDLGYRTHMSGKWHLGNCNYNATPIGKGFDTHFGPWENLHDRVNQIAFGAFDWNWNNEPYWAAQGTHSVQLISNHTQHMLQTHFTNETTKCDPIFMYVPYLVPHLPIERLDKYITNTRCSQIPETDPTTNKTNDRRLYCGMVAAMDDGIGNITQTLRDLDVIDDFIILITSDNGAAIENGASSYPLRGQKQNVYEGGTRARALLRAPKYLASGHKTGRYNGLLHITDVMPTMFKAANGDISVLPNDLDGRSSWHFIRNGLETPRTWMVYNIDSSRHLGAIRFKNGSLDFKLIYSNSSGKMEIGYRYPDPRPQCEQDQYSRKSDYPRNGESYFLYDLSTNPNEVPASVNDSRYPNAAIANGEIFNRMKWRLKAEFEKEKDIITYSLLGWSSGYKKDGAFRVAGC